jgi:putative ABC transport system permease protein
MFWQSVKMAWSSIVSNKMRSFLTMLGIIIGVLALVVLVSIANGATSSISETISSLGTNLLTVSISDDKENPLKLSELSDIQALDGVAEVSPVGSDSFTVKYERNSETVSVTGITAGYFTIEGDDIASGREIRTSDVDNHTNTVIINEDLAYDLLGVTNTADAVGTEVAIDGVPYTVIGVLAAGKTAKMTNSSYAAYIPYTSLQRLSDSVSEITSFAVSAESDDVLDSTEANLDSWMLGRFENDSDAFTITNQSEIADTMSDVMNTMAIMLGGIAAISLLVGGIGIMNIMLVSVTERTREIGIRKAIGAGQGSIMTQFLIEALMVSLMGDVFGVILSWVTLQIINLVTSYSFALNGTVVLIATVFSLAIGLIFGLYPARKAARKKPIDALHYTG